MPTITAHPTYVTQINHLQVAPENTDALVQQMQNQLDTVVAHAPGFISSSIHRSDDGHHVVNYVQFETAGQLDAVHQSAAFQALFAGYKPMVIDGGPHLYSVAHVRER